MEVAPGIYRFQIPIPDNPLGYINTYLFKSNEGCLLVDTGWNTDEAFGSLARQMGDASVSFDDLRYIVVTHAHPDHFGLAGRLMQHTNAQLVMHAIERSFLESRYVKYANLLGEMDQWLRINGVPDTERPRMNESSLEMVNLVTVKEPDILVHGGERFRLGHFDFEAIWTPGHSPGHTCYYERNSRALATGDHVLPGITPNVSMHSQSLGNPLIDYIDSLLAVEQLPVDIVLPAHRDVFPDLPKRVHEIREHHEKRKGQIVAAFGGEAKTGYEIASIIPWSTKGVSWQDLDPQPKRIAVTETLAHLELLRAEGRLLKFSRGGIVLYAVNEQYRK